VQQHSSFQLTIDSISLHEADLVQSLSHIPDTDQNCKVHRNETVMRLVDNIELPSQYSHQHLDLAPDNIQSC
jgi:hypothetical protein